MVVFCAFRVFQLIVLFFAATLLLTFAACNTDDEPSANTNGGGSQPVAERGTLSGLFSINETRQVYFAKGNLQYNAKTKKWKFAEHQYDVLGQVNADISDDYKGMLDLFGFGASGQEGGRSPLAYGTNPDLYASVDLVGTPFDWADNDFVNVIKEGESWVTLTQYMWKYLLTERENASQLAGFGTVVDVKGLILLPDTWDKTNMPAFNPMATEYTTNVYDANAWKTMEDAGAVFLPAAGYRDQKTVNMNENGRDLYYWTGTYGTSDNAIALTITKAVNYIYTTKSVPVYYGAAVRLAKLGPVVRPLGKGKFTVDADGKKVRFTLGNLQYQASTNTWAVASSQKEIIGSGNQRISATNTEWIDLFGWGTGNAPTKHEQDDEYGEWVDWGTNTISNMALRPNSLRTLSREEWEYLFHGRTNAENLFALGNVDGRNGVILLPDGWSTPNGLTFTPSTTKGMRWVESSRTQYNDPTNDADRYEDNYYSTEDWNLMEKNGAIFLPAAGYRDYRWATNVSHVNESGGYWSSTKNRSNSAYHLNFSKSTIYFSDDLYLGHGNSVRLVRNVE